MLGKLIPRRPRPVAGASHDHLFADLAPGGANSSPRLLSIIYEQGAEAEGAAPQYAFFRVLVKQIVGDDHPRRLRGLSGDLLARVRAAYVCCFERWENFERQRAAHWADPEFTALLERTRAQLVEALAQHAAAEAARRAYLSRWRECMAAPLDLSGETLLAQIKQMGPDDWHDIVLNWNWDHGVVELEWITANAECDRATALLAYCAGAPSRVATRWEKPAYEQGRWDYGGFVRAVAARLENGFYVNAELGLALPARTIEAYEREIAGARATRVSPWQLPDGLLAHPGRAHAPRYGLHNGAICYNYDYWLAHLADR
ncbi:MAG TPA: DUF4274 domain-containing protein [Terricaulis sp.]|nr:DUF4274 domain-containing protein [Terricaulis sp.]